MGCSMVEAEGEVAVVTVERKEVESMTAVERTMAAELVELSHSETPAGSKEEGVELLVITRSLEE